MSTPKWKAREVPEMRGSLKKPRIGCGRSNGFSGQPYTVAQLPPRLATAPNPTPRPPRRQSFLRARRWVPLPPVRTGWVLGMGLAVAGFALAVAVAASADEPLTSASTTTTVPSATTTTVPPADTTPDAGVWTPPTTTAAAATTTAPPPPATTAATTTAPPTPAGRYAAPRQLGDGCLVVGAAAVALPGRAPLVLGPFAQSPRPQ